MAWTAGLLLFPIVPGFWELYAWSHRRTDRKEWLTPLDRLSLRTFVVGLAFIGVLLYLYPQAAFVSLSTRGDWMLDNVKDPRAASARRILFGAAGGLEWLYKTTKSNPYKNLIDPKARQLADEATRERDQEVAAKEAQQQQSAQSDKNAEQQIALNTEQQSNKNGEQSNKSAEQQNNEEEQDSNKSATEQEQSEQNPDIQSLIYVPPANLEKKWPWIGRQTLHPAIASMPASVETSIKSVAKYIAKQEKEPLLRIKALHDYVADRIAYDAESFYSGNIPDQDAETTFKTHKSVCAGYANLLSALAEAINEKIIVVTGDARDSDNGDKLTGMGHAWNAAKIGKQWYLIDACWDAGYVSREKGFTKAYKIDYLFPPPRVMIQDHFPEEANWQLLDHPLSQGEFLRQPMLDPNFQIAGLTLLSPNRARNEAAATAQVILKNPKRNWLMAGLEKDGRDLNLKKDSTNDETAKLECALAEKGTYRLNMFTSEKEYGTYTFVGSVDFVNR